MDHSKTVPQLADATLNFFINICQFPFLPVWNTLNPPPPPTSFIPTPSPIYYKNNNRSLSSHNPRLFQKPPRIENSEDFVIHSATSQSGAKGGLHASSWLAISKTRKKLSYYLFRVCCSGFSQGRKSLYKSLHLNINMYFFSLVGDQFLNSHDPNVWFWVDRVRRIWCKPLQVFLGLTP